MRLLSIVLLIVVFILCFAFIHQNMRLKGGADDKILYYNFYTRTWHNGNTEGKYDVSIKYNDDTDDIAIEVEEVISELIEKGVMDEGKIKRINIDVINKKEYNIGNNFKIYWSENKDMITVGCEYNGNCAIHRINAAARKRADAARKRADAARKRADAAMEEANAAKNALDDFMKEEEAETYKLRPSTNQNINTNTNETSYVPLTKAMQQVYEQAYTDTAAEYKEFTEDINKMTDQTYMDIKADIEAAKNKSLFKKNKVAEKIDQEFDAYLYAYEQNNPDFPLTTFEKYVETFSKPDEEKMLNYLENNPTYLDALIDGKKGVKWQTTEDKKHQLVATTIKGDLI